MGAFDFTVITIIGDYKEALKYVRWKCDDMETDFESFDKNYLPAGKCFFREGYVPIIWIPRKPKTPREYGTLAHEALHAVYHMFDWANLPMTLDTEEVMTHSMTHIIANSLK